MTRPSSGGRNGAKRIPFKEGDVEIRQIFELEDFPVDPAEKTDGWREKEEQFRAAPPARKPGTIRFIGLLKADRDTEAGVLPDKKLLTAMGAFIEEGVKSGVFLSGEELQPSSKGARVRYSGSKRTVIDGPFAEDQRADRRLRDHPGQVQEKRRSSGPSDSCRLTLLVV